ncbi:MAG TPA: DNA damage-inducible protein D [Candidatus Paceibacterota bacterium]
MEERQIRLIHLRKTLDDIRHENGAEYWYARELFPILGYAKWENFQPAIERAKDSLRSQKLSVENHFLDMQKMVRIGSNAERESVDIKLTRYACYLLALNGDPRKEEIAFAQAYFASQTRKLEALEARMEEAQRLNARNKLRMTEKEFAATLWERGVDGKGIGDIRNAGDIALFGGFTTNQMKERLGVQNGSLADVLPSVTIKAKDLATEMTTVNTRRSNLQKYSIKNEHVKNNTGVRKVLVDANIKPEELPAEEDIKKIETRHKSEKLLMEKRQKKELEEVKRKQLSSN